MAYLKLFTVDNNGLRTRQSGVLLQDKRQKQSIVRLVDVSTLGWGTSTTVTLDVNGCVTGGGAIDTQGRITGDQIDATIRALAGCGVWWKLYAFAHVTNVAETGYIWLRNLTDGLELTCESQIEVNSTTYQNLESDWFQLDSTKLYGSVDGVETGTYRVEVLHVGLLAVGVRK